MTNSTFASWLENPSNIDKEGVNQLQKMVDLYPYTSVFQILLSKGLHNVEDVSLDSILRKAAISVPDRGVLYQVLYAQKLQETIEKVNLTLVENQNEQLQTESNVEVVDLPKEKDEVDTVDVEKTPDIESVKERNELEEDILIEAINNSIQLDVDELLQEIEHEKPIKDYKETFPKEVVKDETASLKPQKFSDWLVSMKEKDAPIEENIEESPKTLLSSRDLIDRFIAQKNKKINISEEPITPKELGQLSLVENEDFVTETLANIYAKQGKYDKAIKIFEQLMLNFPEKNTFFASRIRFLKEKMEYDK